MSIDILQEKIRKLKNPSVVELMLKGTVNFAGTCSAD